MPLKVNIGITEKIGLPDFGSRGASINLELELSSELIVTPRRLRERLRQLYNLARVSVQEELGLTTDSSVASNGATHAPKYAPRNGTKRATVAQTRTLQEICEERGVVLSELLLQRYGDDQVEHRSVREVTQLIRELKQGRALPA